MIFKGVVFISKPYSRIFECWG